MTTELATRDKLLVVGAELLQAAQGGDVSTRAITQAAGVTAPTLYHHFGSKQNLLDEVVAHGYLSFLRDSEASAEASSARSTIASAWDNHVRFGVEHPAFYAHIYGRVEPGYKCGVVSLVEATLHATFSRHADQLAVPPSDATQMVLAATTGVIITLIGNLDAPSSPDYALSDRVRDAVLDAVIAA